MSFVALGIGVGLTVAGGATSAIMAGSQAKKARKSAERLEDELRHLNQIDRKLLIRLRK